MILDGRSDRKTHKFVRMKMPMLVTIGLPLGYMAIAVTVTRAYGVSSGTYKFQSRQHKLNK
jgi:hypothetical protein